MGLGGVISNLLSLGAKLLPAVVASAQAPSSSSSSPVDQNYQIKAELEKLMRMLERIKAMLYDAEQREIRDLSVKLWLKELTRVAYDAEDVLDEYHYELLRVQVVEARDASPPDSPKKKLIQVPSGMLDQIKQITSRFAEIANDRIALQLSEGDGPKRCNNELQIAPTSHFVVESNIFGREREKEKLIDLLSSECDVVSVVTIVGMGGVGKTTLAQLAYNDQRNQQRFDKYGWICVSEDFNVERLTKESLESITGNECGFANLSALQEKIRKEISGKRVLLVLDDVWNEKKSLWDSFQAPFMSATFAKILVTTRNDHVAQIIQTEPTFNLGYLSAEQCWLLFEHYAFGGVEHNKSPKFVEIGKQIMNKCGMLPLAVKSIASLLSHEVEEESWRDILESELWECNVKNEIFPPLQITYVRLPTHLKSCFLYCSMFPKNYRYNVKYLVKLWKYQGFIESKGNKTAEKIGFEYAQQLCQRSLFEREDIYERDNFKMFKLHDIVHDLARLNSENGCYSIEVSKLPIFPNVLYHLYIADSVNLIDPIPSDKFTALRTLITGSSVKKFFSAFDLSKASKLRALEIWEPHDFESEFLSSVDNLKHLRYLSLNDMFFEPLPECICSLYRLQNLTLKGNFFKELPTKIGNLISLEDLILSGCFDIAVLPESICQLKVLRKLFIEFCLKIKELPNNIGNLISLEELKIGSCYNLVVLPESLCQLKSLRKLFISSCHQIKELPNNIGNLVSLEELKNKDCLGLRVLPESLCQLKALRKLHLINCKQLEELPSDMGNLTNLETLEISRTGVQVLPGSLCQLKALRKLCLIDCVLLKELPSDMGRLINLQTLEIINTGVSYLPPSLSKIVGFLALKVELNCETIGWLKDVPDLGGTLCLCGLEKVPNLMDVQCANLVSMHNLEQLRLSWDGDCYWDTRQIDGSVLKLIIKSGQNIFLEDQSCFSVMVSLEPHPNLSTLQIDSYSGITFPEWIGSLFKLKYLNITSCNSLQFLKAESLPLEIEELKISECHQLVSMPGIQKLKSLVKLSINYCRNLCSFMEPSLELTMRAGVGGSSLFGLTNLTSLKSLKISHCLKLQVLADEFLPVESCNVEVIECPGLREWCLQHEINYEDFLSSSLSTVNDDDTLSSTTETMFTVTRRIKSWLRGLQLGRGSSCTVYEAISDEGFFFAVKEVLIDQGTNAQESITQLEQEIALLSQFEHENIVQYYGTDKDETKLYIFLELVTQGSLASLYKKYHLQDTHVSAYTRQILYGLLYLHERNIVHRDIKCANILVHANGSVKLADFGLAKEMSKINLLKSIKGSVYWMAPEVVNPKKTYGLASDIWSLGCTVLEMLTRQLPYPNIEWTRVIFKIGRGERPLIPNYLSREAQDFIMQCVRVNPDDRPSAVQLLEHPFIKVPLPLRCSPPASQSYPSQTDPWT